MSTKSFFTKSLITLATISASCAALANTSLTIYTSQPNEDIQQTVSAFNEVYPDIEVKWVRDGTTKLMARYQAEQAAGAKSPDLLLIADSMTMESLVQQDMLHAYQSPNADSFSKELYSADGYYYGTKLITTGIGYNTQAPEQPQSWADLTKDSYKNLTVMPSPLYSGAAVIHMATLTDHPDLGWDYYEQLNTNGVAAQGGNGGVLTAIASGSKAYGVIVDYMVMREKAKGAPVEFVFPTEGVSMVTEPVAIFETSEHKPEAEKFVDFLLSDKGQELVQRQGYIPASESVAMPEGFPSRDEIVLMSFDAAKALENTDVNKKKFAQIFDAE